MTIIQCQNMECLLQVLEHIHRSTSSSRHTNRTPDGAIQQQQQVLVACFNDDNEGDSGFPIDVVISSQLVVGENIDADVDIGTPSCSTLLCETPSWDANSDGPTAAKSACTSSSSVGTTKVTGNFGCDVICPIDDTPFQPCRPGTTDHDHIVHSPTVDTSTVSVSRYPQLKARLPTPLLPLVVDARSSSSVLSSPDAGGLSAAVTPTATVYRYSVDPPSPVGYADDSPDREVTPIAIVDDGIERGRFTVWNDVGIGKDTVILERVCPSAAGVDQCSPRHLEQRHTEKEVTDSHSVKNGNHVTDGRGSPDSIASLSSYTGQYLYDAFSGHYSAAGRGYPHGLHSTCFQCSPGVSAKPHRCGADGGTDSGFSDSPPPPPPMNAVSNGCTVGPMSGDCTSSGGRCHIADSGSLSILDAKHLLSRQCCQEQCKAEEQSN